MEQVDDARAWVRSLDVLLIEHFQGGVQAGLLTGAEAIEVLARIRVVVDQRLAIARPDRRHTDVPNPRPSPATESDPSGSQRESDRRQRADDELTSGLV